VVVRVVWGGHPHVNYEPSSTGGLPEATPAGTEHRPHVEGRVGRQKIERTNDYAQAGERYRTMPDDEREDLVLILIDLIGQCERLVQERIVEQFERCDDDFGRRVAEGVGFPVPAGEAVR
jgi:catalase